MDLQEEKLIFVFDDGWDVPYGLKNNDNNDFGSLILNEERFPSFSGEPKERMKKLVDKVKSFGWKGVGLWICASAKGRMGIIRACQAFSFHYVFALRQCSRRVSNNSAPCKRSALRPEIARRGASGIG